MMKFKWEWKDELGMWNQEFDYIVADSIEQAIALVAAHRNTSKKFKQRLILVPPPPTVFEWVKPLEGEWKIVGK